MRRDTQILTFRYTAQWRSYAMLVAGIAMLLVVEGTVVDALIAVLIHTPTLRALLLAIALLLHVLVLMAIVLPPLLTRHHISDTDVVLRYGYDRVVVPRAALIAAREVREPVDILGPLRAQMQADRKRIVAAFSTGGRVLLTLDRPRRFRVNGSEGDVSSILINVDRRDDFLAALGLPPHHPLSSPEAGPAPSRANSVGARRSAWLHHHTRPACYNPRLVAPLSKEHIVRALIAAALLAALSSMLAMPGTAGRGAGRAVADRSIADRPVVVLTGTAFPAGLGLGVAADPSGLQQALWTPLVGFDNRLRPYAALAARVPTLQNGDVRITGGGMRVTIHLKPGLRFSDGSPLTAQDVLFGLRINRDPALGNSFGLDEITHAAAPDDRSVVLQFGDTYAAYLAYALPPALPRAYFIRTYHSTNIHTLALAYARDPYMSPSAVFSGPYRVAGVEPGQRITLVPNRYFTALPVAGVRPALRYVILSDDEGALARALHAPHNGVDVAPSFDPAALPALQGLGHGRRARVAPALAVEHLELNMATPALRDLRVRRAIQAAIDKRALARAVFPPSLHPTVATSLIPSASPYHDGSLGISAFDPAGARKLLQAAGYTPSLGGPGRHLTLTLAAPDDPMRRRAVDLLAHALAAIGVRIMPRLASPSPSDRGGFYAPYDRGGVLATRHFDLALFDLRLGPDPATLASLFDPDRVPTPLSRGIWRRNYTGIDDEALAQLPEVAQSSLDVASRKRGYDKVQRMVTTLLPYIVLYERPQVVVDDGRVHPLLPAPQDAGLLWNVWAWTAH